MLSSKSKKRLDIRVLELHPQWSRTQVRSFIMQGKVLVDGEPQTKAGYAVSDESIIRLVGAEPPKYVSRGGLKLEKALDYFHLSIEGYIALDAGISTGGFTDCLLQHGASRVYGIDVGYGQVHERIRIDPRVVIMEKVNVRDLCGIAKIIDLVTLDLSFISVLKVMDSIKKVLKPTGTIVILIKPQFEAERFQVGRGGIIKDPVVHQEVVCKVTKGMEEIGFTCMGVTESPILGATGNKEFLGCFIYKIEEKLQ